MPRSTKKSRAVNTLAEAITAYRERLPKDPSRQHEFTLQIAKVFHISPGIMTTAVRLLWEMEQAARPRRQRRRTV